MKLVLEKDSTVPCYQQIVNQMILRIKDGFLAPNEQLPSVRVLATALNTSVLTVQKAYKVLEKKGLVVVQHGKGVYVKNNEVESVKIQYGWQGMVRTNVVRSRSFSYESKVHYNFSEAIVYPKLLPASFLAFEMEKMLKDNPSIVTTYSPIQGDEELRCELASYLNKNHRLNVSMKNILITNGVQQGINLIAQTLLRKGDIVLIENPCYSGVIEDFLNKGIDVIPVDLDGEGIQSDVIEEICRKKKVKLVYVNPDFQNPTGIVMSSRRRKELLDLAELYGFFIMEDDSFSDIYFDEKDHLAPIKSEDRNGHVIYVKGFSKTLAPGIRIAAVVADGPVFNWLHSVKATMDLGSPLLTQKAILPIIRTNRMKDQLEKLRTALSIRRDMCLDCLSIVADQLKVNVPKGGFNLWVELPQRINQEELLRRAIEEDVQFLLGSFCYFKEMKTNHIRISYASLSDKDLKMGMNRLANLIKNS